MIHGSLAFTAAQSVFGAEDSSEEAMAASAMAFKPPLGRILVGLVGLIVIGVGLYQLYAAYGAKFREELQLDRMNDVEERWVILAGRVGAAARAPAIGVAGAFVVLDAYQSDPSKTRGFGRTLEALQRQPSGSYMLGLRGRGPPRLRRFHAPSGPPPPHRARVSCGADGSSRSSARCSA